MVSSNLQDLPSLASRPPGPLPETDGPPDEKINILLVDDAPEKLLAVESVLSDLNQNVMKAQSGREALRLLLQRQFAVILLDINMPGMDGFETASLIRQRPSSAHTPIIFVTSFSTADTEVYRGYALGAVDYLFTPLQPEVLRSKISVFIALEKNNRQLQRQAEALRRAEEERLQRRLHETTTRLEWETRRNHFFRLSIELLAIADYAGVFAQTNPTWEKALGYADEYLHGKPLFDFVHPNDLSSTREILAGITDRAKPAYFENRFRDAKGAWRWLGWTIAPFADEGLLYIFARDITERHEREDEIRQLNEDLKKQALTLQDINQELEAFSYSIAHDLRTPILAVGGYTEILLAGEVGQIPPEAAQLVRAVSRNSERMTRLIDDFLAFFRIGRQEVKSGYIDMAALTRDAIAACEPVGRRRALQFRVDATLPQAKGDPAMVRQVLINLISNAVKFTARRRKAEIQIGCLADRQPPVYFVRDNGVGFDMKHVGKLFGVFQRLHSRDTFDGTGIGLAIVQKIVQRHGGTVWAEGKENAGASFYFTLGASQV